MRAGGSIVNVASLAGMVPVRFQGTYGATKAGLRAFSKAIRQELRERRISVSVVSPGPVDTGCTLGYLSPRLLGALQPSMERRGARAKRAYIDRKRAH